MVHVVIAHVYAKEGPEVEAKIRAKLAEAAREYLKTDKETLSYIPMQDTKDPRAWTVVERYEKESSFQLHAENPYSKRFLEDFIPLIEVEKNQLLHYNELDTSA